MEKISEIIFIRAICLGIILSLFCGSAVAAQKITFTDAIKRKVEVSVPAKRLVVLNSDAAEVICALGAGDMIVGIGQHVAENGMAELFGLEKCATVGSPSAPSMERIIELQPDLVISYEMWLTEDAFEAKLTPMGIQVARIPCYKMDTLADDIRLLGKITGKEKEAEAYIANFQKHLDEIVKRLKDRKDKVRVYAEGYGDYNAVSKGSGGEGMIRRAYVDNITSEQPVAYPTVSPEWVVDMNPDVIIKASSSSRIKTGYGTSDMKAISEYREGIMKRPAWDHINAVKNNRVFVLSNEIWVGPRSPIGILYIAKWCYPEIFRDLDPEKIHREWLMKWHKTELKGIYVYP
jgi:iron complex transport system substrate-binding protein